MEVKDVIMRYREKLKLKIETITNYKQLGNKEMLLTIPGLEKEKEEYELVILALKKQTQKKVENLSHDKKYFIGHCPTCNYPICRVASTIDNKKIMIYCSNCGQSLLL